MNLNGGTLQVNTAETIGQLTGTSGTTVTLNAGLTLGDATDTSIASTIGGVGGLTKLGTSTVTLGGANAYTGATTVNAGTLIAANATALGTTAAGTTVANGATLQIANVAIGAEAVTLNGPGAGSAGALVGTGSASLGGAVTLGSASTIAATAASDSLTLGGTVNGAQALTQAGAGTVSFANTIGATTALTSFTSNAGSTTGVNGGLLRTTGAQSYNGALTTGGPTTLQTTNSDITANGTVNAAAGTLTFAAGAGNVTMSNAVNDFGTVAITSAGAVNLIDANALVLGTSNVGTMQAQSLGGNITVNGTITASGAGDSIVLAATGNFVNNAGAAALNPGPGRWLVWSTNPALDTRGGLPFSFKQYNASYGVTPVAGTGNGFLYSVAPSITPSLTGSVMKAYNGTTAATTLTPANYAVSGAIDGDIVTLNNPASGTYDTRNVGTNKNVAVSGLSISSATDGAATVYGYQLASTTANASIGTIDPAGLTLTAATNTKTYDGATSAAAMPTVAGLVGGDTVSGLVETYADKNAGSGKMLSVTGYTVNDGNGGNNYTVSTVNNTTGVIDQAALTGSITASNKVYDANTSATITSRTLSGVISGDTVSYVGGAATFSDKNAAPGKTVTAAGLGLAGLDAGNYTVNTTATTTADITALGLTGNITAANKVYDGTNAATITSRTLSGVIGGDTVSYVGGTATFSDQNTALGKTVTAAGLGLTGLDAGNYTVNTTATTTADITARPLTVTADAGQTKVYGNADPLPYTYAITSGSLVGGDSLGGVLSRNAGENVGNYAITQNTLSAGSNYGLSFVSNPFAITPATLSYVATPVSIFQGTPFPPFTGTVAGFKAGDTLASATTGTLVYTTTAPNSNFAGVFPIDGSGLSAQFGNYVFVQIPANAIALVIAPSGSSVVSGASASAYTGAVASAAQGESACAELHMGSKQETLCGAQQNFRQSVRMNLLPGWQRVIQLDNVSLRVEGSGIRLPAGAGVQ